MNFNRRMFICLMCAAVFICSAFDSSEAQTHRKLETAAVKYAKNYPVSKIEKSLPLKPQAIWFQELVGVKTPVSWEINDCGEQTGDPSADRGCDFPLCVEASARQSADFYISVNIQFGTFKRGVTKMKPIVRYISVGAEGVGDSLENLIDLEKELNQRKINSEVLAPNDDKRITSESNRRGLNTSRKTAGNQWTATHSDRKTNGRMTSVSDNLIEK